MWRWIWCCVTQIRAVNYSCACTQARRPLYPMLGPRWFRTKSFRANLSFRPHLTSREKEARRAGSGENKQGFGPRSREYRKAKKKQENNFQWPRLKHLAAWGTQHQPFNPSHNALWIFASLGEECLTPALKGRCQNQMKRRQTGPERLLDNVRLVGGPLRGGTISSGSGSRLVERATGGLCEVHFLPLVVEVGDSNRTQRLRCAGESSAFYTVSFCFLKLPWNTICFTLPFLNAVFAHGSLQIWSFIMWRHEPQRTLD